MAIKQGFENFDIRIDGKPCGPEMQQAITQVVVDTSLHLPAMFEMHLTDAMTHHAFRWIDRHDFKIGMTVRIDATGRSQGRNPLPAAQASQTLIEGEVTALEVDFDAGGSAKLIVRGYDPSHRLHVGSKTATFLNMSDAAIFEKVVRDAGLKVGGADATHARHEYVIQNNQSDMAFLRARARRIGFELRADEKGALHFRHASRMRDNPGDVPSLEWGDDLYSFHPRLSALQQTRQVSVRAWDTKTKTLVQGAAQAPSHLKQGGALLQDDYASALAKAKLIATDRPSLNPDSARALAEGLADEVQGEFVKAEGLCAGHPGVRAGRKIKLTGLGQKFSGPYWVTAARHHYTARGGYTVSFSISGRHADTLAQTLAETSSTSHGQMGGMSGVVVGVVTNNNDPQGLGRVKVKFPWLGDQVESAWCRVAAPMAGGERGFYFIPEVNDEALVAFEHGDPNAPFLLGALWSVADKPPKPSSAVVANGKVNERVLRSRSGHEIVFCDKAGEEKITIVDKEKNSIVIDSTQKSLTISVKGDCAITAKGQCSITAEKDISLKSTTNDVTIECTNFEVKAKAKCTLKGQAELALAGGMVSFKADGPLALDGKPVQLNQSALVVL